MGHGGTLDPLASGVLVVGVGSGTKKLSELLGGWKEYEAACVFGIVTDMYDAEGKILRRTPTLHITRQAVEKQLESFRGEIQQRPPMYTGHFTTSLLIEDSRRCGLMESGLMNWRGQGKSFPVN
jgi:tRNA pseudouridine55 synthase